MELLFESRLEINALDGMVRLVLLRPYVSAQPVLEPDNSGDGAGCSIYGSVLGDGGVYRMWYQGWPRDWDGKNSAIVCYAESDDGVTWRKPELQLDARFEAPNNVTNLGMHAPSVFIDPDAPPSHRYRATGAAGKSYAGAHPDIKTKAKLIRRGRLGRWHGHPTRSPGGIVVDIALNEATLWAWDLRTANLQ